MSKSRDITGAARTLSGSYILEGKKQSYKVTIHGPTRAEAAQVLSDKKSDALPEMKRDPATEAFVMKPHSARRLGVGKRG